MSAADQEKPASAAAPEKQPAPKDQSSPKEPTASQADPRQTHLAVEWKYARPLTACRFDPLGRFVLTGAEDNSIQRWTLTDQPPAKGPDGKPVEVQPTLFEGHDSWVRAIAFSPDGKWTYTGGYDGQLFTWETVGDKPAFIRKIAAHNGWVRAIAVSADGKQLASCGNDQLVKLWDTADGRQIAIFKGHESHVYNLAFHPDGKSLVSCDLKANFKHWELATGKVLRDFKADALYKYDTKFRADIGGARSLAFSLDGKLLAAGGITNVTNAFAGIGSPAVADIDWESGKLKLLHTSKEAGNGVIWGVAPHIDGYWIGVSGSRSTSGGLFFWKPDAANEFFKFKLASGVGRDLALHPDGLRVAVACADGYMRVYKMQRQKT
ncbi:MAG: WD40 repeat domain-containing protein [Planctomycetes bacterium]|nr:WD40 repeat domain-containing protein [Planctomycetota bacterium]